MILPALLPALLTGFALAFARAVGEYGSVIFIAGNMPCDIRDRAAADRHQAREFDYAGATGDRHGDAGRSRSLLLLAINVLQAWSRRRLGA